MHSTVVSSTVFVLVCTGGTIGMWLRGKLPVGHLGTDSKDTMRLAIGLVVTMTSLVLGMLVSSAKTYYDGQKNVVAQMSSDIILLDALLGTFGPDSKDLRVQLRKNLGGASDRIWPKADSQSSQLKPRDLSKNIYEQVLALRAMDATQASIKAQISATVQQLTRTYWLMYLNSEQATVSVPLLCVVTCWLIMIFVSFGIFAPPNSTVIVTLVLCALAVSAAVFIIMEMYSPFSGIMRISPVAVHDALAQTAVEH